MKGVALEEGEDPRELSYAGPDGVGLPTRGAISFDSVGVFSDPLGLGVDMASIPAEARDGIVAKYGELLRERFPSATDPRIVMIGPHMAVRIDMPRVEMRDRPVRSGRHYLILDGVVTVSVDCLWLKENAGQMS